MSNLYDQFKDKIVDPKQAYACSALRKDVSTGFNELMMYIMRSELDDNEDDIKRLVKNDFTIINKKNDNGYTPLMLAVMNTNTVSNENVVRLLIELGADINETDVCGRTALMLSTIHDSTDNTVYILLQNNANIYAVDTNGNNALFHAIINKSLSKICILVDNDICINTQNLSGNTALHMSIISNSNIDIMNLLLSYEGINVNIKNDQSLTPLMVACKLYKKNHVIKLLSDKRVLVNCVDHVGRTALILSSFVHTSNQIIIIDRLLRCGADINIQDVSGRSFYDYAHLTTILKLLKYGLYKHKISDVTYVLIKNNDKITAEILDQYYLYRRSIENDS